MDGSCAIQTTVELPILGGFVSRICQSTTNLVSLKAATSFCLVPLCLCLSILITLLFSFARADPSGTQICSLASYILSSGSISLPICYLSHFDSTAVSTRAWFNIQLNVIGLSDVGQLATCWVARWCRTTLPSWFQSQGCNNSLHELRAAQEGWCFN